MIRRTAIVLVLLIAVFAAPLAAQNLELGASFIPTAPPEESLEFIWGSHLGYKVLAILYGGWDALVVPPHMIQDWTGYYRPGFLNLFDAGLRLDLGPLVGYATVGLNRIYVYRQDPDGLRFDDDLGANLRVGAGLKFGSWGLVLNGRSLFPNMDELADTLRALGDPGTRDRAFARIQDGLIPSLVVTLYL